MRRAVLMTTVVLGTALSLVSGQGLFAALSDTARTGVNSIDTQALAGSADMQIAPATLDAPTLSVSCGSFGEDLTSPLITVTNLVPGEDPPGDGYWFCLRNVGTQTVEVTASTTELSDIEVQCSGDEAFYDTSCGDDLAGELGSLTRVALYGGDCAFIQNEDAPPATNALIADMVTTPVPFGTLAPNQTRCFQARTTYFLMSAEQRQIVQTDRVSWRYAFTGAVPA